MYANWSKKFSLYLVIIFKDPPILSPLLYFIFFHSKKNDSTNLRDIFQKMLLFGVSKPNPVKDLFDHVIKEGRVNDFSDCSNNLNDFVSISKIIPIFYLH